MRGNGDGCVTFSSSHEHRFGSQHKRGIIKFWVDCTSVERRNTFDFFQAVADTRIKAHTQSRCESTLLLVVVIVKCCRSFDLKSSLHVGFIYSLN